MKTFCANRLQFVEHAQVHRGLLRRRVQTRRRDERCAATEPSLRSARVKSGRTAQCSSLRSQRHIRSSEDEAASKRRALFPTCCEGRGRNTPPWWTASLEATHQHSYGLPAEFARGGPRRHSRLQLSELRHGPKALAQEPSGTRIPTAQVQS